MTRPEISFGNSFCIQEFILSRNYNKKLEKFANEFEIYFKENKKKILNLIESYTGFIWDEDEIKIWFFDGTLDPIPDPILVSVKKDNDIVLFEIIRMLTLNLLIYKGIYSFYKEDSNAMNKIEVYSYLIGQKIIKEIMGENILRKISKTLKNDFNVYLWEDCEELKKLIDLDLVTVKKSLEEGSYKY